MPVDRLDATCYSCVYVYVEMGENAVCLRPTLSGMYKWSKVIVDFSYQGPDRSRGSAREGKGVRAEEKRSILGRGALHSRWHICVHSVEPRLPPPS